MNVVDYEVNLYIDGVLIGDCRKLAQDLKWVRRRTRVGADEIDFTLNDVLFNKWCVERNTDINTMLRPLALECRIKRNGIDIVGGFLATMPAYSPNGTSANLALKFDGYLNLLGGVYIRPIGTVNDRMDALIQRFISEANTRSGNAGKSYGFIAGNLEQLATVEHNFDNYKSTKDWICDRCDNITGAGNFDVYFHSDKTYDVKSSANFGDFITDWVANYPTKLNGPSATSISAAEVSGFASAVIGIGSGEVSSNASENTAIISEQVSNSDVVEYGYYETILQDSSVAQQSSLDNNVATELTNRTLIVWEPEITLSGRVIEPKPTGTKKIWVGDIITIRNDEDLTGMTNGRFRVNELEVSVSASGSETIKPILKRYEGENSNSQEIALDLRKKSEPINEKEAGDEQR